MGITKEWLIGFIEGEGNFHVALSDIKKTRPNYPFEYYPVPQFRIFLREDDLEVLQKIKEFLGFGEIYHKSLKRNRHMGFKSRDQYNFVCSSLKNLLALKTLLSDGEFFSKKKQDTEIFFKIVDIRASKRHLTPEGYQEVISLTKQLNSKMRENFKRGSNRKFYDSNQNQALD